jgi:Tol biopolymer transport system component
MLTGCSFLRLDSLWGDGDVIRARDAGVPLKKFQARDGEYFPGFVEKFFPKTKDFAKAHPTLEQASHDIVMIEVRPLNTSGPSFNESNLSWSADGAYLGFEVLTDGFRKIMLKNLDGDYARELRVVPKVTGSFLDGMVVKSAQSYNAGLRWSKDSTRFAFMSNGGLGEYGIYVGAIGATEQPVASSPSKDGYATWSPTSNEIAFVSGRSGNGDIYLIDLSSGKLKRLSNSENIDIFPEWFPSGNQIVYASGDSLNHDLHMVERAGPGEIWHKPWALTNWSRDDLRPTVSPDGKLIAFYSDGGPSEGTSGRRWNIIVVPYVSGKTYNASELSSMVVAKDVVIDLNTGPAWSPDCRKIFYVKRDPTAYNPIYAYDLYSGRSFIFKTKTKMNRDILMSKLGILSFRAQVGVWDKVFVALTNQGQHLQNPPSNDAKILFQSM